MHDSRNNLCEIHPIKRSSDQRGWFVKPISGKEPGLEHLLGEFYLVMAVPGEVRGNHYHEKATEWFSLIQGKAQLHLLDIESGKRQIIELDAKNPQSIVVQPGVAHAFFNISSATEEIILTAFSNILYDTTDTIPYKII